MTPTLILPPRFSDDSNALWRAAIALDWNIERLQNWRVPESFDRTSQVAIYGESLWANFVAQQLGLRLYEPPLDWLAKLSLEFVGRQIGFCTLKEARQLAFPLFVKPAGEKAFEARVYACADELPPDDDQQESLWVLTSEVVEWEVEYRFFVLNGKVEAVSSYWRGEVSTLVNGVYEAPTQELQQAREFVLHLLGKKRRGFGIHGVVVDVGLLSSFGWAVVEANPAFGAGIYDCNPQRVLEVVKGCVVQEQERRVSKSTNINQWCGFGGEKRV
jgi:hypothetical protein